MTPPGIFPRNVMVKIKTTWVPSDLSSVWPDPPSFYLGCTHKHRVVEVDIGVEVHYSKCVYRHPLCKGNETNRDARTSKRAYKHYEFLFWPLHLPRLQIILCTETSKKYYNKKNPNQTIEDLSEKSKDNSLCSVSNQMQRQALPHERPLCLYVFSLLRKLMEDV